MANPVAVTLVTVLKALKLVAEPLSRPQPGGPAPLRPDHCWLFVVVVCCDGLVVAKALLSP